MKITLLLRPPPRSLPLPVGPERYQRLADELGRHLETAVQTVQSFSLDAVGDGYLLWVTSGDPEHLLGSLPSSVAMNLAARTVLIDVSWQQALPQLEQYRFAAAVDSLRLSEWLARPSSTKGPFGLNRLASVIGASCTRIPSLRSRHYCLLEGERHPGMPHVLADYLRAYDEDQKPLSAFSAFLLTRALPLLDRDANAAGTPGASVRPLPRVERASIKRTLASLERARKQAQLSVLRLSELTGIEPELLKRLETGDAPDVPLGVLREYAIAMREFWGWCLAGVGEAQRSSGGPLAGGQSFPPLSVPGLHEEETVTGGFPPPVFVEQGYTVRATNFRVFHPRSEDGVLVEAGCQ